MLCCFVTVLFISEDEHKSFNTIDSFYNTSRQVFTCTYEVFTRTYEVSTAEEIEPAYALKFEALTLSYPQVPFV